MGILWPLSTLTAAEVGGFPTTVITTTPEIASQTASLRVHVKTLTQALRYLKSCENASFNTVLRILEEYIARKICR